tara:strand:+ start:2147 stop:3028 length:882 start_codon:yes stop_codon:yes gene_type:complete
MDEKNFPELFDVSTISNYPPENKSPNFEGYFFKNYNKTVEDTGLKYLPIQWTNYYLNNQGDDKTKLNEFLNKHLDKEKKYFTITQYAGGPSVPLANTLVFSMGGMQNTPKNPTLSYIYLPLLFKDLKKEKIKKKEYLASYVGRKTHPVRIKIEKKLKYKKDFHVKNLDSMKSEFTELESNNFKSIISRSYFSICPRGYGPTSFRLYESLALGSIPIYVSDEFILPFNEIIDWNNMAVLIKPNEVKKIPKIIKSILDTEKYNEMLNYGQHCFEKYFNFQFMDKYVMQAVAKFRD